MIFALHSIFPGVGIAIAAFYLFVFYSFINSTQIYGVSILSYVCMFSAYPKRQKPNWLMIGLMLVMYAIVIFADMYYIDRINYALTRPENPIVVTPATQYIYNAQYYLSIHIVTVIITMVTVVLEPVFAKLLKKINTSIEVEGNGELGSIDISDED